MPEKHTIAYEKLLIGPVTTIGEMTMGGHWLEMLKVQKQAGTYSSYMSAAAAMWKDLGVAGFYKGFWPAGFFQGCYKGLPVLFVQGEMKHKLAERGVKGKTGDVLAGVTAGVVQGAMVSPTQRVKVLVATNAKAGAVGLDVIRDVIRREGMGTLMKGTGIMMVRRGVDWGVRFYGKSVVAGMLLAGKPEGTKMGPGQQFFSGLIGGGLSACTQPLDVWVANAQKHREVPATASQVFKELVAESKAKGFFPVWFRGVEMRIVHSGYHTAWMAGLGAYISEYYRANWKK